MSSERRGSHRWPVPSERQTVAFKVGRKLIEGRLADVSAGGFAVELDADASFEPGTQVEMHTGDGTHVVQIAHVKREGNKICLGVIRVRDLPPAEARTKKNHRLKHVGNPLFVLPVLAGVLACSTTLILAWMGPDWLVKSILDPVSQLFSQKNEPEHRPSRRPRSAGDAAPKSDSIDDETPVALSPAEIAEIEGSWTAWASHLNLSIEQLSELKVRLNGRADEMVPSQLADLPDDIQQQIYDVLTAEQKERLTRLRAASKAPPS